MGVFRDKDTAKFGDSEKEMLSSQKKGSISSKNGEYAALKWEISRLKSELKNAKAQIKRQKGKISDLKTGLIDLENAMLDKAKYYKFSLLLIRLCVFLHSRLNLSLRQVSAVLSEFDSVFSLGLKIPSHESIRLWCLKLGYYRGEQSAKMLINKEVCLIVDESFQVGQENLLLILGVDLGAYAGRAVDAKRLRQEDVEVLYIKCAPSWKGADVGAALLEVENKLKAEGATISYTTSDRGHGAKSGKMAKMRLVCRPNCVANPAF